MSDLRLQLGASPGEQPGDDDAREARHQVLATLLGAYADGELPPETTSQIDAHLLGCARCRREVAVHSAVRTRLAQEPMAVASAALRTRILAQITATPVPAPAAAVPPAAPWWKHRMAGVSVAVVLALGVTAAVAFRVRPTAALPTMAPVAATSVPLFGHVLDDYRRVMAGDLPGRARDLDAVRASVPFPVQPLPGSALRLLAAWSTDLDGEPAAVLAYRWQDRMVLQYLIAEPAFFRNPGLRTPIATQGLVAASSGAQGLLAWAEPTSGAILIGDVTPGELAALRVAGTAR